MKYGSPADLTAPPSGGCGIAGQYRVQIGSLEDRQRMWQSSQVADIRRWSNVIHKW